MVGKSLWDGKANSLRERLWRCTLLAPVTVLVAAASLVGADDLLLEYNSDPDIPLRPGWIVIATVLAALLALLPAFLFRSRYLIDAFGCVILIVVCIAAPAMARSIVGDLDQSGYATDADSGLFLLQLACLAVAAVVSVGLGIMSAIHLMYFLSSRRQRTRPD